jgi:pimeloyl-ACP methyl ester carboxylesterase
VRDVFAVLVDGVLLHGTSHLGPQKKDLGILFLNSGSLPRSSRGDLYAHLSDALSERGWPCFRVDLPGLGDSQGDVPREFVDYYRLVQEGAYAGGALEVANEMRSRYGLSRLVLAGICGGAQTAVFAAGQDRGQGIAGLALLDMEFFLYRSPGAPAPTGKKLSTAGRVEAGIARGVAKLRDWVLAQRWEPQATRIYYGLRKVVSRTRGATPPPDTNAPLLEALSGLLGKGVPVLMLTAHSPIPEPESFDYIGYLAGRAGGRLDHAKIMGTTHSFVENDGEAAVLEAMSAWLGKLAG